VATIAARTLGVLLLARLATACESTAPGGGGGGGSPRGLAVITTTAGIQPDSNGYTVLVDGASHGDIGPNDSLTLEGVEPGSHAVELADIEFNCATLGQFTRTVSVTPDTGAVVGYSITCDAPSRSRIAFVKNFPDVSAKVTVMNADGSELVNLTDSLGLERPEIPQQPSVTWSPDGKRVAFTRYDGALLATTGDAGGVVQLAPLGIAPLWSGDGSKVAFLAADFPGQPCCWDIFVAESDGSGVRQLTDGLSVDGYDFAANGSLLAFKKEPTFPLTPLSFIRPDGTGYREILPPGLRSLTRPSLSPDGSKVVYFAYPDAQGENGPGYEIYVSSTDGSGVPIDISNNPGHDLAPVWSPVGDKIAFVSDPAGGGFGPGRIHVVNADGTGQAAVTPEGLEVQPPAWSPDGTRIAFAAFVGNDLHVFVANADGSGRTDLTPDFFASLPSWTAR
jgi:Tol biopolymer transport system component